MNAGRDVERLISNWLDEEAPARAPDRILTSAALVIDHTKQRRAWRMPWRLSTMNPIARLAGAALVGVVAVGVALFALRPSTNVGVTQTPGATSSPSAKDPVSELQAYRNARNAVCAAVTASPIRDVGATAAPSAVIGFLRATIARGNDEMNQLEAINAPADIEAEHLANIQTGRDTLALLNHEVELLQANKIGEAATVDQATGSLGRLFEQFEAKYGLQSCP